MKLLELLGRKRAAAALAVPAAVLMGIGGVATTAAAAPERAPAPEATPLSCSHPHSNKDSGEGRVDADWLNRRVGPHPSCASYGLEKRGKLIYYHCYVQTKKHGTWTWGRVAGTNKQGWFKDSYLSDNGATVRC